MFLRFTCQDELSLHLLQEEAQALGGFIIGDHVASRPCRTESTTLGK